MTSEENGAAPDGVAPAKRRRRLWWVVATVVLVVVALGAFLAFTFLRESTTPVDVDEAVNDFRREESSVPSPATTDVVDTTVVDTTDAPTTTSIAPPGSVLPEPGVYTYATTGGESIDALGGRSHEYPEITTITVIHRGCGAIHRWRPLRERWDATTYCPSARGMELRVDRNHHEFFGIGDTRDFVCRRDALFFPATTERGETWTARCSTGEIDVVRTGTILGTSRDDVGGKPVTVLEFEVRDVISGASNGTTDRTVRVIPATGLIVELELAVDVQNDSPIGDVHYEEQYELRLTSLEPRR